MDEAVFPGMTVKADSHLPRKVFHLIAASVIPTVYYFEALPRQWALGLTLALTVLWVSADMARIKMGLFSRLFKRWFGKFMKDKEASSITGSSYVLIGSSLSLLLFTPQIACASIYFMSIGDPVAAIAGKELGRARLANQKSFEGSAAMFLACASIGSVIIGLGLHAIAGAAAATAVELFPGRLDDNLAIPLIAGSTMAVLQWLL